MACGRSKEGSAHDFPTPSSSPTRDIDSLLEIKTVCLRFPTSPSCLKPRWIKEQPSSVLHHLFQVHDALPAPRQTEWHCSRRMGRAHHQMENGICHQRITMETMREKLVLEININARHQQRGAWISDDCSSANKSLDCLLQNSPSHIPYQRTYRAESFDLGTFVVLHEAQAIL